MASARRKLVAGLLAGATTMAVAAVQTWQLTDDALLPQVLGKQVGNPHTGPVVDASCDVDGVTVSYDAAYSPTPTPAGYRITTATVGGVAPECNGATVTIALSSASSELARASAAANATDVAVRFAVRPPARDVTRVHVEIAGGTTPIPADCRTIPFDSFRSLTPDADTFAAGKGNDLVYGLPGNDTIRGDNKDDCLVGQAGNDALWGDNHADVLIGGDGNDTLDGGNHDDVLIGGPGNDVLRGGNGRDVCRDTQGVNTFVSCEVRQ